MLRVKKSKGKRQKAKIKNEERSFTRSASYLAARRVGAKLFLPFAFCLLPFAFLVSACRQDMHDQPKYKPLRPSRFFSDGQSARQPVEGVVPYSVGAVSPMTDESKATTLPFAATEQVMDRGQERFNIYCAPCHGALGYGNGMIVQRGFRAPPSYHIDRLRQAPVGHFYDVMTNGFGAMPSYADKVAPHDRWAVAAYVRALQLSQHATLADVPPEDRDKVKRNGQGGQTP
jgi:mono/diheme cytochrome c family protein